MTIPRWLMFSLLTAVLWGLWGFESKLLVDRASPDAVQILFTGGLALPALVALMSPRRFQGSSRPKGALFAFLTGLLGGIGNLAMYRALEQGKTAVVVSVTSLAPLVTVLCAAAFLNEKVSNRQRTGIALAMVAIVLMSV